MVLLSLLVSCDAVFVWSYTGLLRVRAAEQTSNPRAKTVEVSKLLKTIIDLPHKVTKCKQTLVPMCLSVGLFSGMLHSSTDS